MFSIIEGSVPKSAVYKANLLGNDGPSLSYKDASGKPRELQFKYIVASMSVKATRHEWKTLTLNLLDKTKIVAEVDEETLRQIRAVVKKEKAPAAKDRKWQISWLHCVFFIFASVIFALMFMGLGSDSKTTGQVTQPAVQLSVTPTLEDGNKAIRNALMTRVGNASDLLAGAELDLKQGRLKSLNAREIGAMLEVINLTARELHAAWHGKDKLEPADVKRVQTIEARLTSFQKRALPQLRLSYKKVAAEVLWEHDVEVVLSGSGNTVLSFYGYFFSLNANIKASAEQIYDLTTQLRFRKLQFASFRYAPTGSAYTLEALGDGIVATFDNGSFTKIDHAPRKL